MNNGSKFKYWLMNYMRGRRGVDEYSKFLLYTSVICFIVSCFITKSYAVHNLFYVVGLLMLVYAYARMMSRNLQKRQRENLKYLQCKAKVMHKAPITGSKFQYGSNEGTFYKYFKCPKCSQNCRVPKNKGKIRITCPKCGHAFERRS